MKDKPQTTDIKMVGILQDEKDAYIRPNMSQIDPSNPTGRMTNGQYQIAGNLSQVFCWWPNQQLFTKLRDKHENYRTAHLRRQVILN